MEILNASGTMKLQHRTLRGIAMEVNDRKIVVVSILATCRKKQIRHGT